MFQLFVDWFLKIWFDDLILEESEVIWLNDLILEESELV